MSHIYVYFTLLAYTSEQIYLPHAKYMIHCSAYIDPTLVCECFMNQASDKNIDEGMCMNVKKMVPNAKSQIQ